MRRKQNPPQPRVHRGGRSRKPSAPRRVPLRMLRQNEIDLYEAWHWATMHKNPAGQRVRVPVARYKRFAKAISGIAPGMAYMAASG